MVSAAADELGLMLEQKKAGENKEVPSSPILGEGDYTIDFDMGDFTPLSPFAAGLLSPSLHSLDDEAIRAALALRRQIEMALLLDDFSGAHTGLNRLLTIEPNNLWALCCRATICWRSKDLPSVLLDLQTILSIEPSNVWALCFQGEARLFLKEYDAALTSVNKALEINLDNALALRTRGAIKLALGSFEEAIVDLNGAVRLNPVDAVALRFRGVAKRYFGNLNEALSDLDAAYGLKRDDDSILLCRGETKLQAGYSFDAMGRPDKAEEAFYQAIADFSQSIFLNPNNLWSQLLIGQARLALNEFDAAILHFDRLLLNPLLPPDVLVLTTLFLGEAKVATRKFEEAIPHLRNVLPLTTSSNIIAITYRLLGEAEFGLGNAVESCSCFRQSLALKSDRNVEALLEAATHSAEAQEKDARPFYSFFSDTNRRPVDRADPPLPVAPLY